MDSRVGCAHVSTGSGLSSWLVSVSLLSFPQKLYSEKCELASKPGGVLLPGLLSAAGSVYLCSYTTQGHLWKGGICSAGWALPLTSSLIKKKKKMRPQTCLQTNLMEVFFSKDNSTLYQFDKILRGHLETSTMTSLAKYTQGCKSGTYIPGITNSHLTALKTCSIIILANYLWLVRSWPLGESRVVHPRNPQLIKIQRKTNH